jgi:hypothetical protein
VSFDLNYRVVGRRRDDADGLFGTGGRQGVHGRLEELGGAGADHEVVAIIDPGVADEAMDAADLALELRVEEPAEALITTTARSPTSLQNASCMVGSPLHAEPKPAVR